MVGESLMEVLTLDFETYYDKEYSLSKLTTEEYVRDPRFEVIMVGLRWPDGRTEVIDGTHLEVKHRFDEIEWGRYAVLCHNTMFDGAILAWRFGVNPAAWLDTLSMGRAMFGSRNNSLASLAKRYGLEDKGTTVQNMMGRRGATLSPAEFQQYAEYCLLDVELCHQLWQLMSTGWYNPSEGDNRGPFPLQELKLIDLHIRMFTEPILRLNLPKLETHLQEVLAQKAALMERVTVDKTELMSNQKFAVLLEGLGVEVPTKISPTTGKQTFAFAKTDPGMKALLEHESPEVQALAAARLGVKSTLEETRTQRFIDIAKRDPRFPVPLKYAYARTKRSSGCLVAETMVLVYDPAQGPVRKRIVDVLGDDLVWDGEAFVPHEGVQFSGYREVIHWDGVTGTPDHVVFTEFGEISLSEAMQRGSRIKTAADPTQHELDSARALATHLLK
jgi:DNA polymerase III epsilon subunit-like protein